jgi:hypothetical protein
MGYTTVLLHMLLVIQAVSAAKETRMTSQLLFTARTLISGDDEIA